MDKDIIYRCDPNKNIECRKSGCKAGYCSYTTKKEYSIDGVPLKALRTKDVAGIVIAE